MGDADALGAERGHVLVAQVHTMRAPDVALEPAELLQVLDRPAAVELLAVLLLLHGLGEVRVQAEAEPASELGGVAHQLPRDRKRGARRDHELGIPRREALGLGQHLVGLLDQRVGRQASVGLAEIHRAP
jgi:hypothetical protein